MYKRLVSEKACRMTGQVRNGDREWREVERDKLGLLLNKKVWKTIAEVTFVRASF